VASIMPRRTTRRQAAAAAACARSAALERVHSAPGLLAAILTHLKKPTDLNSAAASCHAWREAGLSEDVDVSFWRVMSEAFPLVAVLKARPDCIYTWRQLYVQRVVADRQTMLLSDGTVAPQYCDACTWLPRVPASLDKRRARREARAAICTVHNLGHVPDGVGSDVPPTPSDYLVGVEVR
jgi:hypothetical protein